MLRDEVMTKLQAALPGLRRKYRVRELYLFGSMARGDARPDSDVDVLVEFEAGPEARPTLFTLGGLLSDLEDLLGRRVDLGERHMLRPFMREEVEREMRRVA
jgi:predicted nucleotidyltransferase